MNYFDGLQFIGSGIYEHHTHTVTKNFTYYGIQYNHEGDFKVVFDRKQEYAVSGPYALVTYPGPHFNYGSGSRDGRTHCWVCFTGERAERFAASGLLPMNPDQPLIRITKPEQFFETMHELNHALSHGPELYNRAVNLLETMLLQLHEQNEAPALLPPHQLNKLRKLIAEIKASPQQEWDFEREAAGLFVSITHFRRLFKQFTTLPPQQFLINCRMQLAVRLLLTSDSPVSEVAENCGFDDEFYFSRMFKKHFHLPPLAYRREFIG